MALPTVTIVFLVFNRREELRESLRRMAGSDYPGEMVDVIVVDNASTDGAGDMVAADFPEVRLIRRDVNCGVSGWNDGFAVAQGDFVLALDDDCYLPPDGLRRAVEEAQARAADLVSFAVISSFDPSHRFDLAYRTGMLTFWGCAVLMRREVLERLRGYDPEIFVWANEVEFMLRFYEAGFRHLHLPEVVAIHMKKLGTPWMRHVGTPAYRMNTRNLGYVAGRHLRAPQAAMALTAMVASELKDAVRGDSGAVKAIGPTVGGFTHGLRRRGPRVKPEISRAYRQHFLSYASPWWLSRPPALLVAQVPGALVRRARGRRRPAKHPGRMPEYYGRGARFFPEAAATLDF